MGSIPGSGRSPAEGNGNPVQYSSLGNPMDRVAWRPTIHAVRVRHDWVTEQACVHQCNIDCARCSQNPKAPRYSVSPSFPKILIFTEVQTKCSMTLSYFNMIHFQMKWRRDISSTPSYWWVLRVTDYVAKRCTSRPESWSGPWQLPLQPGPQLFWDFQKACQSCTKRLLSENQRPFYKWAIQSLMMSDFRFTFNIFFNQLYKKEERRFLFNRTSHLYAQMKIHSWF